MKKLLVLFIGLLFGATILAQSANDVVYLNNGNVIKGTISNVIPDEKVTIQTPDGSLFVLNMSEVTQISHEEKADGIISFPDWANDVMTRKGYKLFIGNRELSDNDIQELFSNDMCETYYGGKTQLKSGNICLMGGVASLGATVGAIFAAVNAYERGDNSFYHWESYYNRGDILVCIAILSAIQTIALPIVGGVFRGVGNGRLSEVVDEYNNSFVNSVSFNLQPGIISTNGGGGGGAGGGAGLKFTVTF